jgi:hypothetical protein
LVADCFGLEFRVHAVRLKAELQQFVKRQATRRFYFCQPGISGAYWVWQ